MEKALELPGYLKNRKKILGSDTENCPHVTAFLEPRKSRKVE
jgi:hypothetical protein